MPLASVCPGGAAEPQGRVSSVASLEAACARSGEQPREPGMRPRGGRSRQELLDGPSRPLAGHRKGRTGSRRGLHWHVGCGFSCPLTGEGAATPGSTCGQDLAGERRLRGDLSLRVWKSHLLPHVPWTSGRHFPDDCDTRWVYFLA